MDNFKNIRMFYQKKGRANYISHLDINRLMQRVLKRAGLPVWYTEGFNPHIYLTFALPLSLGYESDFETMDFRLTEEMNLQQVQQILNQNMPEGILVTRVAEPVLKPTDIALAEYIVEVKAENCSAEKLYSLFESFYEADSIEVIKKSKRGERTVNLKPDISLINSSLNGDYLQLEMRFPAGTEKNYNPSLLFDEFSNRADIVLSEFRVLRTNVISKDGSVFC